MISRRHTMALLIAAVAQMGNLRAADTTDSTENTPSPPSSSNGASSSFGSTPGSGGTSSGSKKGSDGGSNSGSAPGSGSAPAPGGGSSPPNPAPGPAAPGGAAPSFRTTPSTNPGAAPDFGVPPPGGSFQPGLTPNGDNSGTSPLFPPSRTGVGGINPGGSATPFSAGINATPPAGAASTFGGAGAGGLQSQSAPVSFTIPGGYGQAPIRLTVGEGRLARPLYRFTGTVSVGYDDNILTTPTRSPSTPSTKVTVVTDPGTPETTALAPVQHPDGSFFLETVTVPAVPPSTKTVTIPGVDAPKRTGSIVGRGVVGWDVQFASRRTVFTFDLNVGDDYYFDRPGTKSDYSANLSLAVLHKFTPRLQVSANVSAAYQTQPNLAQINTSTNTNAGPFITINAKGDVSYRLLPRFTTVTSVSYNTIYYEASSQKASTFATTTFGTELRYLFSPRVTLVGELRYSSVSYAQNQTLDSHSDFFLGGVDFSLSRRFTGTLRVGEEVRTFTDTGAGASAPFLELTSSYNLTRTDIIQGNARFGFEQPPDINTKVEVLRGGISYSHAFSPRLSGVLSLNLVHEVSTNDLANTSLVQNTVEANAGLNYTLSRQWSFGLNYTYTTLFSAGPASDYFRNRLFLNANYTF